MIKVGDREIHGLDAEPKWAKFRKKPVVIDAFKTEKELKIPTLEGEMTANPGDWVIRGVKGEVYPCKPDVFQQTYEKEGPKPKYKMGFKIGLQKTELAGNACCQVVLQNDVSRFLKVYTTNSTYGIISENRVTKNQDCILLEHGRLPLEKIMAAFQLISEAHKGLV